MVMARHENRPLFRTAVAGTLVFLAAATSGAAWQTPARTVVAVPSAETSDMSLKTAADRLTTALRATIGVSGIFELYDTALTRKSTLAMLPARFFCLARVSPAIPGWVQATIAFADGPLKDPVVRFSSPVLLRDDSAFISFARLAWERLAKAERKRLDSLRTR